MGRRVSGIVLAGGQSRRMGRNKALLTVHGEPLIQRVVTRLREVAAEIIVVTNEPTLYPMVQARFAADRYRNAGPLAGLHAGLLEATHNWVLTVACDMPYLNVDVLRYLVSRVGNDVDAVVPHVAGRVHPLHAVYHRRCLPFIERCLQSAERHMIALLGTVRVRYVAESEIALLDPSFRSFRNANTWAEWQQLLSDDAGVWHDG